MKKLINVTLMFAVCTIIALSGCKYEDGPLLSLHSKETRVAANWEFKRVIYASTDLTSYYLGHTWEIKKDGQFNSLSDSTIEHGKWNFVSGKEALDFRYDDGSSERYKITRLTSKELWVEFTDDFSETLFIELSAK
jgi:hypothetical protein